MPNLVKHGNCIWFCAMRQSQVERQSERRFPGRQLASIRFHGENASELAILTENMSTRGALLWCGFLHSTPFQRRRNASLARRSGSGPRAETMRQCGVR
jgi:hypothetical protein